MLRQAIDAVMPPLHTDAIHASVAKRLELPDDHTPDDLHYDDGLAEDGGDVEYQHEQDVDASAEAVQDDEQDGPVDDGRRYAGDEVSGDDSTVVDCGTEHREQPDDAGAIDECPAAGVAAAHSPTFDDQDSTSTLSRHTVCRCAHEHVGDVHRKDDASSAQPMHAVASPDQRRFADMICNVVVPDKCADSMQAGCGSGHVQVRRVRHVEQPAAALHTSTSHPSARL